VISSFLRPPDLMMKGCPNGKMLRFGPQRAGSCFPASGYSRNLGAPVVLSNGKVVVAGAARRTIEGLRDALKKLVKMGLGDYRLAIGSANSLPETVDDAGIKTIRWPIGEWTTWTTSWSAIAASIAPTLGVIPVWPLGIQPGGDVMNPSHYAPTVAQAIPMVESLLAKTKADDETPWVWYVLPVAAALGVGSSVLWMQRRRRT
jgi:hypothetical protein